MKFIAHRGNLLGPEPDKENRISQIELALQNNFDVEIDVRLYRDELYLGHDVLQEQVPASYLYKHRNNLWIHAKNLVTFLYLLETEPDLHVFCHDADDVVFTNQGKLWTHPRHEIFLKNSVALKFEYKEGFITSHSDIYGICSDSPGLYQKEYMEKVLGLQAALDETWQVPCSFSGCTKLADIYRCPWGDFAHCTEHDDFMLADYNEYCRTHESNSSGKSDISEPDPSDDNSK